MSFSGIRRADGVWFRFLERGHYGISKLPAGTVSYDRRPTAGLSYRKTYDAQDLNQEYETYGKACSEEKLCLSGGAYLPQGKVAIFNTTFQRHGFSPLPVWREPPESLTGAPNLKEKYPLILSDYHTSDVYSAAWLRNIPNLRELHPDPLLHIHPDAAAARDIRAGDWVRVESPHGWIKVKAELYPGIRPDSVMVLHGWWQGGRELLKEDTPLLDGGANVNVMYSVDPGQAYDPLITL
jgi:anaerobic selenocysteine-containing dehydrogenase